LKKEKLFADPITLYFSINKNRYNTIWMKYPYPKFFSISLTSLPLSTKAIDIPKSSSPKTIHFFSKIKTNLTSPSYNDIHNYTFLKNKQ